MPKSIDRDLSVVSQLSNHPNAIALIFVSIAFAVTILWVDGRGWWCPAGDWSLWSWNIWSQHNSQHIIDPYSFTHVLHGVLEFWLVTLLLRRLPLAWRLLLAVMVESTWEIVENSNFVIERYRAETISLSYFGDSIINSISDIACCACGFLLAFKLGFWRSAVLFFATETILALTFHDSFLINILMLIYPVQAVKAWQMAG